MASNEQITRQPNTIVTHTEKFISNFKITCTYGSPGGTFLVITYDLFVMTYYLLVFTYFLLLIVITYYLIISSSSNRKVVALVVEKLLLLLK